MSKAILTMQKDRYFEGLTSKYWNTSGRIHCPVLDDSKGITINSLGGIFIATLVGLMVSMITLAYELWQQKKLDKKQTSESNKRTTADLQQTRNVIRVGKRQVHVGTTFGKTDELPTISGMSF